MNPTPQRHREMRPCPLCGNDLDTDPSLLRDSIYADCDHCGAKLEIVVEEIGEETCVYFEERQ